VEDADIGEALTVFCLADCAVRRHAGNCHNVGRKARKSTAQLEIRENG